MAAAKKAAYAATIPFEVKNRWTGEVQFTAQITCAAIRQASRRGGEA